jgi:hypothetical protein
MKMQKFHVVSGRIALGDPCYESNKTVQAKNGIWTAHVYKTDAGCLGRRVSRILVHHEGFNPMADGLRLRKSTFFVDSGQAGVFDSSLYGGDEFYEDCCRVTLSKEAAGFVPAGFVSSSGFGDGEYKANVHIVDNLAVCVELIFI